MATNSICDMTIIVSFCCAYSNLPSSQYKKPEILLEL